MLVAITTTYKPDAAFAARFTPLLAVCGSIIVSDNTPGGHQSFNLPAGFTVLRHMANCGLAPALNKGIQEAMRQGATSVILFDQDSTPTAEFVTRMAHELQVATGLHGPRCAVGPVHVDDGVGSFETDAANSDAGLPEHAMEEVSCLPTSGISFLLEDLGSDDLFSDEFFLDLVDFEWCWRLRQKGWHFLRTRRVRMLHRLGVAERRFLGLTFHVPAPYRHYFQVRDSLRLVFKDYVPSYSKIRLIAILPVKALIYPFILDRGLERLAWMLRGTRDCIRGVRGMGAASTRLSR